MSQSNDEEARTERARRIGLFRYMLIREAADPGLTRRQRGALVRKLAQQEHIDADGRPVRISRWTLDRWILEWRQGGFDALVPSPRQSQPRRRRLDHRLAGAGHRTPPAARPHLTCELPGGSP
ncbi:hypothetical protein O1M63_26610 [Streptomyces mirabilis]|nr:hypothetical protein [Streptomyces mirabilis]